MASVFCRLSPFSKGEKMKVRGSQSDTSISRRLTLTLPSPYKGKVTRS